MIRLIILWQSHHNVFQTLKIIPLPEKRSILNHLPANAVSWGIREYMCMHLPGVKEYTAPSTNGWDISNIPKVMKSVMSIFCGVPWSGWDAEKKLWNLACGAALCILECGVVCCRYWPVDVRRVAGEGIEPGTHLFVVLADGIILMIVMSRKTFLSPGLRVHPSWLDWRRSMFL